MKKVLVAGVFDLIHPGHIYFLHEAKKYGDYLIVLLTHDVNAEKQKRKPIFTAKERKTIVEQIKCVDKVIIGEKSHNYKRVAQINPDYIVLGQDQKITEQAIYQALHKFGWKGKVTRLEKSHKSGYSTTNILQTLKERNDIQTNHS